MSGPAPKPVELKLLEGNRGHRPVDLTATFRPEVGLPPIPKSLSADGRKAWKRLSPELLRYNLMSVIYSDAFEELCETAATVKLLRRSIEARKKLLVAQGKDPAEAYEVKTPNGMPVQSPTYQTLKAERNHLLTCIGMFGLAPSEQAKVTTAIRAQLQLFENPAAAGAHPPSEARGFAEFS